MTTTQADRLLSPNEVADALHVSRRTVDRMIRDGRIPAIKLGEKNSSVRIDPVELAEALRATPEQNVELVALSDVAARVGRDLEWALARVGTLPCVARDDGYYVRTSDLRSWHRATAVELETRDDS